MMCNKKHMIRWSGNTYLLDKTYHGIDYIYSVVLSAAAFVVNPCVCADVLPAPC